MHVRFRLLCMLGAAHETHTVMSGSTLPSRLRREGKRTFKRGKRRQDIAVLSRLNLLAHRHVPPVETLRQTRSSYVAVLSDCIGRMLTR